MHIIGAGSSLTLILALRAGSSEIARRRITTPHAIFAWMRPVALQLPMPARTTTQGNPIPLTHNSKLRIRRVSSDAGGRCRGGRRRHDEKLCFRIEMEEQTSERRPFDEQKAVMRSKKPTAESGSPSAQRKSSVVVNKTPREQLRRFPDITVGQ